MHAQPLSAKTAQSCRAVMNVTRGIGRPSRALSECDSYVAARLEIAARRDEAKDE
jgi:hypothetical protein